MPIRLGRRTQRWAQATQRTLPGATGSSKGSPSNAWRMFGSDSSPGPRSPTRRPSGGSSPGKPARTGSGVAASGSNETEGARVKVSGAPVGCELSSIQASECGLAVDSDPGPVSIALLHLQYAITVTLAAALADGPETKCGRGAPEASCLGHRRRLSGLYRGPPACWVPPPTAAGIGTGAPCEAPVLSS